jgi:hypothetical protein
LLSDLLQPNDSHNTDESLPGLDGVTYRIEVDEIAGSPNKKLLRVLEIHDVSTSDMKPVRISLANAEDMVTRVERYMDTINGVGQHLFHLDLGERSIAGQSPAALNFTAPNAVKSQSWRLQDDYVDIEISDSHAVVPVAKQ